MTKSAKYAISKMGERNPMWKGDAVGKKSIHQWIIRRFPKPEFCSDCKIKKPYDLANISQEYKRDLSDWEWLCRTCHMTKDGRLNLIHQSRPCSEKNKLLTSLRFKGKKQSEDWIKKRTRNKRVTTFEIAQKLRSLYPSKKIFELAKEFNLTREVISNIVHNRYYKSK